MRIQYLLSALVPGGGVTVKAGRRIGVSYPGIVPGLGLGRKQVLSMPDFAERTMSLRQNTGSSKGRGDNVPSTF